MDLKQLLNSITPDIYSRLKLGVEIGKWPDGKSLTSEQKELCMQAKKSCACRLLLPMNKEFPKISGPVMSRLRQRPAGQSPLSHSH